MTACHLVGMLSIATGEFFVDALEAEWHTGDVSMRGLIGDRFLKWFVGGFLHWPRPIRTNAAAPETDNGADMMSTSDRSETEEVQGKEDPENSEKTGEITKLLHPEGGSDRSSGVTQPPDEFAQNE